MANNTMIGTAEQLGLPVIDPIISFSTQISCLAAAVAASSHSVKRWTAVKTLTPPELVPVEQSADAAPAPKGLKKVFNKKFLARLVGPLIGLSVYIFFVFGIRMIKNRTVINSFWVGFMVFIFWAAFETSTASLVHPAKAVSLIPLKLIPGYQLKFEPRPRSKMWTLGAAGASIACAVSFYFGYQLAAPIMAAAWTFTLISTFVVHRITARHMMMIVNGYLITCITLGAIVGAVVTLFESSKDASSTPSEPKTDTTVNPSMWVMEYMTTLSSAFPTWIPGFMLALAMRFDHSRSLSQDTVLTKTTPGESAAIPRSVASFACPTFNAGLFALAFSVAALKIVTQLSFPIAGTVVEMTYVFVTVPVTTLGLVFGAWKHGQLKAWWLYEETWVPTVKKDEEAAKSDAEATPADETDDEKTSLLQPSE